MTPEQRAAVELFAEALIFAIGHRDACGFSRESTIRNIRAGLERTIENAKPTDDIGAMLATMRAACAEVGLSAEETAQIVPTRH